MMDKRTTHAAGRGRLRGLSRRAVISLVLAVGLIAGGAIFAYGAVIGTPNSGGLVAVGPVSGETGFPSWYKDKSGIRLEPCLDAADPNCAAAAPLPDTSKPMSFPDNFPDELFYQLADSVITDPAIPAFKAVSNFNLEGAFGGGVPKANDQIVFGRVRFFYKGLPSDTKFRITHPYGVDEVSSDTGGAIRFTEDGGLSIGQFGEALNSRIGPFLQWDTGAPAGYLGDGATEHAITGSPYNTNYVQIQSLGADGKPDGKFDEKSALFTVMGKKATTSGVGVDRVTYSRTSASDGMLDVYANTDPDAAPAIEVSGDGIDPTPLRGQAGHYVGRVPFASAPPASVTVTNTSDVPASKKTANVTDAVRITSAAYDADAQTLTVNAESSDRLSSPKLTAKGYGDLDANGVLVVDSLAASPPDVTVTSGAGGSATVPVTMTGKGFAPTPAVSFAGADQQVLQGATVTLDGGGSTGPITGYHWTQTAGPNVTLTGADAKTATFTAPSVAQDTTLTFELKVDGPGSPAPNSVDVTVLAAAPASADSNAGPDQTVAQAGTVKLDGTGSTNATGYAWRQTGGPAVTLTGANTATPSFTMPKGADPLTFQLTASNASGADATPDEVVIKPRPDNVTISRAQYTRSTREWRVEGTSDVFGPGVTVTVFNAAGAKIGPADVDTLGAWKLRVSNSAVASTATVTAKSSSGGSAQLAVSVK
jgi:K319-like protein